jgi:hypothetical protein
MNLTPELQTILNILFDKFEAKLLTVYGDKDVYRKNAVEAGVDFMDAMNTPDSEIDNGVIGLMDILKDLRKDPSNLEAQPKFVLETLLGLLNEMIPTDGSEHTKEWDNHFELLMRLNDCLRIQNPEMLN